MSSEETQTTYSYRVPSSLDTELAAIAVIVQVLNGLLPDEQQRAVRYLGSRYEAPDAH